MVHLSTHLVVYKFICLPMTLNSFRILCVLLLLWQWNFRFLYIFIFITRAILWKYLPLKNCCSWRRNLKIFCMNGQKLALQRRTLTLNKFFFQVINIWFQYCICELFLIIILKLWIMSWYWKYVLKIFILRSLFLFFNWTSLQDSSLKGI